MKKHKKRSLLACMLTVALLLTAAGQVSASDSEGGVMERIRQATAKKDPEHQVENVILVPKNIVKVTQSYQGGIFYTLTRKDHISRFKCSSCHNNKKVSAFDAAAVSHADIKVVHGSKDKPLSCNTCHNKENRDMLTNAGDQSIDFDHVYNMCGQCHFRQKKDWIGGAHGKRVSYWAGQRVVNNCTTCHNPHSPRFEKRWPATYSVPLTAKGRSEISSKSDLNK